MHENLHTLLIREFTKDPDFCDSVKLLSIHSNILWSSTISTAIKEYNFFFFPVLIFESLWAACTGDCTICYNVNTGRLWNIFHSFIQKLSVLLRDENKYNI